MLDPRIISDLSVDRIRRALSEGEEATDGLIKSLKRDRRSSVKKMGEKLETRLKDRAARIERMWRYENGSGVNIVAGVDEVGRGPLAGPVYAAAVVLPPNHDIADLTDSKAMTPETREIAFGEITKDSLAIGVGSVDVKTIDRINVLHASMKAMRMAIADLSITPELILIDGNRAPGSDLPEKAIVKGDSASMSIAAASVVAKVTRDRFMVELDEKYPGYGFAKHKGYGTPEHLSALRRLGLCPEHRLSYSYVADVAAGRSDDFFDFSRGIKSSRSLAELAAVGDSIAVVAEQLDSDERTELRQRYIVQKNRISRYHDR